MEFPAARRDRIVMGLSIGALILFIANIATFVKQHFFDSQAQAEHAFVVSESNEGGVIHFEGTVGKHAWRIHQLEDGNQAWAATSDDLDCELEREMARLEESLGMEDFDHAFRVFEGHQREQNGHRAEARAREMVERIAVRVNGRRHRIIRKDLSGETVEVHELLGGDEQTVHVEETEGQDGRRSYRVVIRSADDNR